MLKDVGPSYGEQQILRHHLGPLNVVQQALGHKGVWLRVCALLHHYLRLLHQIWRAFVDGDAVLVIHGMR